MQSDKEFDEEFFEWEDRPDELPLGKHMICGSAAGMAEHVIFLPLDNLKTHKQSLRGNLSILETLKYILKTGGYNNFYRGSMVMAAGCLPAHSIFFSIYEISRKTMGLNDSDQVSFFANAFTGVLSVAFHDFILTPCEGKQKIGFFGVFIFCKFFDFFDFFRFFDFFSN